MKYGVRDGITKEIGDTVDGLPFDIQAKVISELNSVINEFS